MRWAERHRSRAAVADIMNPQRPHWWQGTVSAGATDQEGQGSVARLGLAWLGADQSIKTITEPRLQRHGDHQQTRPAQQTSRKGTAPAGQTQASGQTAQARHDGAHFIIADMEDVGEKSLSPRLRGYCSIKANRAIGGGHGDRDFQEFPSASSV